MAHTVLYRFDAHLFRNKLPSDATQIPYEAAQVDFYRQGATVQTGTNMPQGELIEVDVHDPGELINGDRVQAGLGGPILQVAFINLGGFPDPFPGPSTVQLVNITSPQYFLPAGTRLIIVSTSRRPNVYADPTGTIPLGSSLVSDSNGRVQCYVSQQRFDYVVRPIAVLSVSEVAVLAGGEILAWNHPGHAQQNCVLVGVAWQKAGQFGDAISSIQYGGQAMTRIGVSDTSEIWRIFNPPSGPQGVAVQWSPVASIVNAIAGSMSLSNVDTGAALTPQSATGSSGTASLLMTGITPGGLVVSGLCVKGSLSTAGTAIYQTQRWNFITGAGTARVRGAVATLNSAPISWAVSPPANWSLLGVEMKSLAAAEARLYADADAGARPNPSWLNAHEFTTLQAAINALPAKGGEIFLPAGTYTLTSTLTITRPNVTLRGESINRTVIQPDTPNPEFDLIRASSINDHFEMYNLKLDGRATQPTEWSVLVLENPPGIDLPNCLLDDVVIVNAGHVGLIIRHIIKFSAFRLEILGSRGEAGLLIDGSGGLVAGARFINCSFNDNMFLGIRATGNVNGLTLIACQIENNNLASAFAPTEAIEIDLGIPGGPRVEIIACYFERHSNLQADQFISVFNAPATIIDGCYFKGTAPSGTQHNKRAVLVGSGSDGTRVTNCTGFELRDALVLFGDGQGIAFGNKEFMNGVALATRIRTGVLGRFHGLGPVDNSSPGTRAGLVQLYSYLSAPTDERPAANTVPVGSMIWVTDLNQIQVSNGAQWLAVGLA